jgi:outer membrane protein
MMIQMAKRLIILIVMTIVLRGTCFSQNDTLSLSLKDACRIAVENNRSILNSSLEKKKYEYRTSEAGSKLYPQIEAFSNFNYYYSIPRMVLPGEIFGQTGMIPVQIGTKFDWTSGFKATQVLYNQSYFTSIKLSRKLGTLGDLNLQQKKEEIVYQVAQLYYLCKATESQITQLSLSLRNNRKMLEIAGLQQQNDLILKTDYSRITVNKNNLQTQIDNLEDLRMQQLNSLKYILGLKQGSSLVLTDSLILNKTGLMSSAAGFDKRIELQLIDRQLEITSLNRKMNREAYLPSFTGFGQYYLQGQRDAFDFFRGGGDKFFRVGFVGLSLNIPLFDGFEKHSKIGQNDIEIMQLTNTRKDVTENFSRELLDAMNQYETNLTIVTRQNENIKIAMDTYAVSQQGYRQQVVPLSDLLLSESGLTEARLNYFNAILQLKLAALNVVRARGELLEF